MSDERPIDLLTVLYPQPSAAFRPGAWLQQGANEVVVLDDDTRVLLDAVTGRLQRTSAGPEGRVKDRKPPRRRGSVRRSPRAD